MDPETVTQVGAGAGGAVAGVLATYLAFRSKFKNIVYKDTCEATRLGIQQQLTTLHELMLIQNKDIKELLKK